MTARVRLGLARAAFAFAAFVAISFFVAPAQAQSPVDCPACAEKQSELILQQEAVRSFEAALQAAVDGAQKITDAVLGRMPQSATADERDKLSQFNETRKELESKISAARDAVEKLKPELAACIKEHCGPGATPATRGDAPLSHEQPVSRCHPACDRLAKDASDALYLVLASEAYSARLRSRIYDEREWLSVHSGARGTSEYEGKAIELKADEWRLIGSEADRARRQRELDRLMTQLGICNLQCRPPETTPSVFSLFPAQGVPKAICPACEGAALKLKAALATLSFAQAMQELDNARSAAVTAKLSGGSSPGTETDRLALSEIEKALLRDKKAIDSATDAVAKSDIALDDCNRLHPAESCVPPASQGGLPSGAGPSQRDAKTVAGPDANRNSSSDAPTLQGGAGGKSDTGGKGDTDTKPEGQPLPKKPTPETPKAPPVPDGTGRLVPEGGGQSMARMNVGPGYVPDAKSTAVFALEPGGFATGRKFEFHGFIGSGPAYTVTSKTAISTILSVGPDFGPYHQYRLPNGEYNTDLNASQLQTLQGLLNTKTGGNSSQPAVNVTNNPCVSMQPILADAQGQPIAGAYIIVGPPSPTPVFNPGERDGDDRPPTIMRTGSDGSYSLPLTGLTGPIEIRPPTIMRTGSDGSYSLALTRLTGPIEIGVAKGCDSYTSTATAGETTGPRADGSDAQLAQRAGTAR